MEHTLKGSYAAILIGNLITDNEQYETIVRRQLRGNSFKEIVGVLEKYHTFMNLTSSVSRQSLPAPLNHYLIHHYTHFSFLLQLCSWRQRLWRT